MNSAHSRACSTGEATPPDAMAGERGRLVDGYQVSQAIHVASVLGIVDLLADGPRSCVALAAATESHPNALYRLLRALAAVGVLREEPGRHFASTPLGDCLRADAPQPV